MTMLRWMWRKTELWVGRAIRALERVGMIMFGVAVFFSATSWVVEKLEDENQVLVYVIAVPLVAGPFIRFLRWVEPELFGDSDKKEEQGK